MTAPAYWVFAYGSLMWDPGFPFIERQPALLRGYHRRFCLYSHRYRGTPERPGLVLGLDRGGACRGVAFRVAADQEAAVKAYLWEREMVSHAYHPKLLTVLLEGSETPSPRVIAQTFVVDRHHRQYAGRLDLEATARLIATSCGERGPNCDYLINTHAHLRALGIRDQALEALVRRVEALKSLSEIARPAHPDFAEIGF